MKRIIKFFVFSAISILFISTLFADDSPVNQNDGAYGPMVYPLSLKKKSPIRMEKEYLKFIFNNTSTEVIAQFYFVNTDTQRAVTQLTGFPDIALGIKEAKKWVE